VGGNVTRAPFTTLTLTVLGAVARGRALRRDTARPDDRILVTGVLGAAALDVARSDRGQGPIRHVPVSRIGAGRALSRLRSVGACIDVSDGLLPDLGHVLAASGVGAEIDPERVPLPRGFVAACRRIRLDPRSLALLGGEDYELLFTLRPSGPSEEALAERLGAPVREIGRVTRGRGVRGLTGRGFTHF
jgi:thiamine-monophosphate kinase